MNFHKKIGFLAAFLLMVGLGAPDSFAQSISIDVNTTSVTEGGGAQAVTVDVDLEPDLEDGTTVMVTLTVDSDDVQGSPITETVTVTAVNGVVDDVVLMVNPADDADADNERVTILATASGYSSDAEGLTITDDELTIALSFTGITDNTLEEGEETVNVSVTATLQNSNGQTQTDADATTVTVSFSKSDVLTVLDGDDDDATVTDLTVEVTNGTGTRGQLKITPTDNDVNETEDVVVIATAKAKGYIDGTAELTIEDDEQTLTLAVDPTEVTEGSTINNQIAVGVTVTLSPAPGASTPVTVTARINGIQIGVLDNLDASGGTAQGNLNLLVDDDEVDSGMRTIVLTATFGEGEDQVKSSSVNVTLEDNDQAQTMTLSISATEVTEGGNGVVAVTVTFAYPPNFNAATPVAVTTKIDGITVGTGVSLSIPQNMVSDNSNLTIPLPENDDVDSGDRTIVVTASTTIDDGDEETDDEISVSRNVTIKDNDTGPPPTGQLEISTNISNLRENAPGRDVEITATLSDAPR